LEVRLAFSIQSLGTCFSSHQKMFISSEWKKMKLNGSEWNRSEAKGFVVTFGIHRI
jgi:hypothetical protein